jgi:hypothetical protein
MTVSMGASHVDPGSGYIDAHQTLQRLVAPPPHEAARRKRPGSLPRGRRLREEVPPVPSAEGRPELEVTAQAAMRELVELAGGRFDSLRTIPVGHLDVLTDLCDTWGRRHGVHTADGICFSGQPGLRHALDELYPLQDPNRWDRLREAIIVELEKGTWRRRRPPRGSVFDIID